MIFVDSGAWFAMVVPDDPDHAAADRWFESNREPLLTTDYVLDETLTLLKARGEYRRAVGLGHQLLDEQNAKLLHVEPADVRAAFSAFVSFADKGWSFTDCVSYVVIQRLQITTAVSFDQHFRQFGNVNVVP